MPNFKKFLNKKVIFVFVFVLVLATGGFFWWQWGKYQKEKEFEKITVGEFFKFRELPKGFVINETSEGVVLENKEIGISFKVPKGWKFVGYMENLIDLESPDYEVDPETFIRRKGCLITVEVKYYALPSSYLINKIENIRSGKISSENEELIKIKDRSALKTIEKADVILLKKGLKKTISVAIPFPKSDVTFSTKIFQEDEIKCIQEFDQFLEKVSIQ